jgi:SAM-dependent methyltransferase
VKSIEVFATRDQEFGLLERCIAEQAADGHRLEILEAGCGRHWPLSLKGVSYTLTGIDLDRSALEIRKAKYNDLDEIVAGDLRTAELAPGKYDVIYNSFVLEHIEDARLVMENFHRWLKPGGILILRVPDRDSVYGFFTRITPHWLHVYYKKYFQGKPNAGKPGFGPYPTYYDQVVSRPGIQAFCREQGMILKSEHGQGYYIAGRGLIPRLTGVFARTVSLLSLGQLAWQYANLTFVMQKAAPTQTDRP